MYHLIKGTLRSAKPLLSSMSFPAMISTGDTSTKDLTGPLIVTQALQSEAQDSTSSRAQASQTTLRRGQETKLPIRPLTLPECGEIDQAVGWRRWGRSMSQGGFHPGDAPILIQNANVELAKVPGDCYLPDRFQGT
ncbi:hypothetical protein H0H93_006519 [Arthromyces matolae]|nr:hypothetical protein H0H93_006519 [Arthromyces matolae]